MDCIGSDAATVKGVGRCSIGIRDRASPKSLMIRSWVFGSFFSRLHDKSMKREVIDKKIWKGL